MTAAALLLLGVLTAAPAPLSWRRLPRWVPPAVVLILLAAAASLGAQTTKAHGFGMAATAALTVTAAMFGGMPLPPSAFHIARRQPDAGDPGPTTAGRLRGGRMIGVLERAAVSVAIIAGWPEGMAIVLAVKGLARYPDLRDSNVSEQFIIGTFTSVLWAVAVGGIGRGILR